MFARIITIAHHCDANYFQVSPVEIEVSSASGTPSLTQFGLPKDCGVLDRVRCAVRETGKVITGFNTTMNVRGLYRSSATDGLDLAVAMGLLAATGEVTLDADKYTFFGNLSLDGRLNRPSEFASVVYNDVTSKTCKGKTLIIPKECEKNKPCGTECIAVATLAECIKVCCK
jgi:magnesium chelatase family protein